MFPLPNTQLKNGIFNLKTVEMDVFIMKLSVAYRIYFEARGDSEGSWPVKYDSY